MGSEQKILKVMLKKQGVITAQGAHTYIIVPRGDMRCRPAAWLAQTELDRLLASGAVIAKGKTFILAPSYKSRMQAAMLHGDHTAFANQHQVRQTRDIYHPDGIKRPTQTTTHLLVFRRLATTRDKTGHGFLLADEIEAGERFAADYARAMMAAVATQSYDGVTSGGKNRTNTAENISVSAMDARKRVMQALDIVGPGLDKALTGLCGHDMTLGALERSENWAKGSGRTVLKMALSRLSGFYGCRAGERVHRKTG